MTVIEENPPAIAAEQLLAASGFGVERIDDFFAELKALYDSGLIEELRNDDGTVYLRVRTI